MSDWIRCRDLSDEEMEDIVLQCFPPRGKEYWKLYKTEGMSYLERRKIPEFRVRLQYPNELTTGVFICFEDRKYQNLVLPPSDVQYVGLLTKDDLKVLEEKLNAIGAGFEHE